MNCPLKYRLIPPHNAMEYPFGYAVVTFGDSSEVIMGKEDINQLIITVNKIASDMKEQMVPRPRPLELRLAHQLAAALARRRG